MNNKSVIKTFLKNRVTVTIGNIATQKVEAIVNAANSTLFGGGGVDGAIHNLGGKQILEECKEIRRLQLPGGLPTGQAVITSGGKLLAQYVIHTVGPIKGKNGEKDSELLAQCYQNCLKLAVEHNIKTIAFPSISTGAFGYPREEAAIVSSQAIKYFLANDSFLEEVRLVFYERGDTNIFFRYHKFELD